MQNTGQYGVSDSPQFVVGGRPPPAHLFSISHDNMSIAPPAGHPLQSTGHHPQQQQQHHLSHHLQAQHHHYGPHPGHQPHPSLQQIHQTQSPHASHAPHPQFPLAQHAQAQQQPTQTHQQQQASPHPDVQQQQQVHQQQQQQQQQQQVQQAQQAQQQAQQVQQAQQQAAQQAAAHQAAQQAAQQAQQQAMVQQLGLGGPDSPEVPSPGVSRPSPTNYNQQIVSVAQQDDDGMEEEGRSTGGNRWPRQETLALIKIRSEMDANFRDSGLKGPLWEEVSRKLAEMGFQRNAKKCKEKFENVHKYYKKTKDGRAGRQDGKSYRFFSQLEALYGGQPSAAQLESNAAVAAAASLLTGTPMLGKPPPTVEDYNVSAQRPSEVSTGVTLSESSEDDYDAPGSGEADNQEKTSSKKRKRMEGGKSGTSSQLDFFESLMKNLLDKQESMQKKFLEFMERREQERQVREEAWRRQEIARVAREHELRTQEHSLAATRDAALVAFLQKVTGQTLQLPQIPTRPPLVVPPSIDSVVAAAAQKQQTQSTPPPAAATTPAPPASATPSSQALVLANVDEHEKDSSIDPNSKRWPKPEVLTLIKLRSDMEPRFQEAGPKGPLWEEISQGMACLGYNRNQKRCKEKWENINKYFRKTKESNKKRPENAKTCPYFHQLDTLYRSGVLGTPSNKQQQQQQQQVVKVAESSPAVDHQALPLAHRFDAVAKTSAGDATDILKMLPAAAEVVQNAASSGNGTPVGAATAPHFFSSPENGSSAERGAKPVSESSL